MSQDNMDFPIYVPSVPLDPLLDRLLTEWITAQKRPMSTMEAVEEISSKLLEWAHANGFHQPIDN